MSYLVCLPPALQRQGDSLAAPAVAGQGAGSRAHSSRRAHGWQSIGDLLNGQSGAGMLTFNAQRPEGAPLAGEDSGRAAPARPLPVGNHGENLSGAQA